MSCIMLGSKQASMWGVAAEMGSRAELKRHEAELTGTFASDSPSALLTLSAALPNKNMTVTMCPKSGGRSEVRSNARVNGGRRHVV